MPFYSEGFSSFKCALNQDQLTALENLTSLVAEISPECNHCRMDYLSAYTQKVYNPYPCEEYSNIDSILQVSSGGFYLLGEAVQIAYLPVNAPDKTRIILKDHDNTWGDTPLKVLNFSKRCAGIKLNKKGITASFVFSSTTGDWRLEAWSYEHITTAPIECNITNQRITLVEGNDGSEYFIRVIGTGYSTFVDIDNIWSGEDIRQVLFYPERGELIVDLSTTFLGPINPNEDISFTSEPLGDSSGLDYYKIFISGTEILPNLLKRQRIIFDSSRLDMIEDGDIFLRDISIVLINKDTQSRDSLVIDQGISEINVFNANSFYLYKEYEDYIFKPQTGEIIPTINGKLRARDELIIRYTKLQSN